MKWILFCQGEETITGPLSLTPGLILGIGEEPQRTLRAQRFYLAGNYGDTGNIPLSRKGA